jgi:hypothetical protein
VGQGELRNTHQHSRMRFNANGKMYQMPDPQSRARLCCLRGLCVMAGKGPNTSLGSLFVLEAEGQG